MGVLFNTGQDCTAGSRLYVQSSIYDKFLLTLSQKATEFKAGPGHKEESSGGPVVRLILAFTYNDNFTQELTTLGL